MHEFGLKVNLKSAKILDFGCGTGNYLKLIYDSFGNKAYGVEPSDGMREKAIKAGLKIDEVKTLLADHKKIVTEGFIQNIRERNFSMFRMISNKEIKKGIERLQRDLGKEIIAEKSCDTLVWIKKEMQI